MKIATDIWIIIIMTYVGCCILFVVVIITVLFSPWIVFNFFNSRSKHDCRREMQKC